jgi:hypothetical protein
MMCWALALLASCGAVAQTDALPDPSQFQVAAPDAAVPTALGIKFSVGVDAFDHRRAAAGASNAAVRAVLDMRHEWRMDALWSATLSDRIELFANDTGASDSRHALREAFVTLRASDTRFADLGRINVRSGVGVGFNPTDWLREGASVPQTSQSPAGLRENRLGTFMARAQTMEDWGAAQVALIPHLARKPDEGSTDGFEWGRTNDDRALHLRVAPKVSDTLSLDLLAYARDGRHPQWGMNLSAVLSGALIAHAELATGVRAGLGAPGTQQSNQMHQRLATGATWTAENGAVITVERHIATDALNRDDWQAWSGATDGASMRALAQLRARRNGLQEPLTRDAWFVRAAMTGLSQRANVDLAAFVRINPYDQSCLWQVDASWHVWARSSVYATVGGFAGAANSEFGANPVRTQMALRLETVF